MRLLYHEAMHVSRKKGRKGRWRQRRRTRKALLDAARRLLEGGESPSITAVADAAEVSRATAYRYFPSERALALELQIESTLPGMQEILAGARGGPLQRAAHVQRVFHDHAASNEAAFRHFLSAVHEHQLAGRTDDLPPRGGRRLEALEDVLGPLGAQLGERELENLRLGLAMLVGVEALLVLRDVCGLDSERAGEVGEWAVRTLIRGALAGATGPASAPG
jgi:AcrR family transcriptional regulator